MVNRQPSVTQSDFLGVLNGLLQYNYFVNAKSQPNKAVDLTKLEDGMANQIALWELTKALQSCNLAVRNNQQPNNAFAMGRSFGRYGGIYDLRKAGDLSLRTEYDTAKSTEDILMLNYLCHLRRLVLTKNGPSIEV